MLVKSEAYVCQGPLGVLVFPCYFLLWNWDESARREGRIVSNICSQQNLAHQPPCPGNEPVPAAYRSDLVQEGLLHTWRANLLGTSC